MKLRRFLIAILICYPAYAQPPESLISPRPQGSYVLDQCSVLSKSDFQELNTLCADLDRRTQCEVAIVVIESSNDIRPHPYAVRLFNHWGIGKRGLNNGTLLMILKQDRKLEIVTGTGVRAILNQEVLARLIHQEMLPELSQGHFGVGILKGCRATVELLKDWKAPPQGFNRYYLWGLLPVGLAGLALGKVYWDDRPARCVKCAKRKTRSIHAPEIDQYLSGGQQMERQHGQVFYRLRHCDACQHSEIERLPNQFAKFCPGCGFATLEHGYTNVVSPTPQAVGHGISTTRCLFCQHSETREFVADKSAFDAQATQSSGLVGAADSSSSSEAAPEYGSSSGSANPSPEWGGGTSDGEGLSSSF